MYCRGDSRIAPTFGGFRRNDCLVMSLMSLRGAIGDEAIWIFVMQYEPEEIASLRSQ